MTTLSIPPTREALYEAEQLCEEVLADIELSRVSLAAAALKVSRVAKLLNRFDAQHIFNYEA